MYVDLLTDITDWKDIKMSKVTHTEDLYRTKFM